MTSVRIACVCAVLMSCVLSDAGSDGTARALRELAERDEEGYEGGLGRSDLELAGWLASRALATGIPRKTCDRPDPAAGQIVASLDQHESVSRGAPNAVLAALTERIEHGNRRQRDIALVAVREIGPGSELGPDFLQGKGPWSRQALSAVTCETWSSPNVHDMWSAARVKALEEGSTDYRVRAAREVEWMIEQMLDRTLTWPEGVFSSSLTNRPYADVLTEEQVLRLVPVLEDPEYPTSIRLEAIYFVQRWSRRHPSLEQALAGLYAGSVAELRDVAGSALVDLGSALGADVLADRIESDAYVFAYDWVPGALCAYPPRSERLVRALRARLDDEREHVRSAAIEALGCLRETSAIPALGEALDSAFWGQQLVALEALDRMPEVPPDVRSAVARMAREHWSSLVRSAADEVLAGPGRAESPEIQEVVLHIGRSPGTDHGLPVCHGDEPGDGAYRLPWLGSFDVRWEEAKVHDLPPAFPPVEIREMRSRTGYGTNSFLRVHGGWLFATDLWHYDGDFGFVSDDGSVDRRFGPSKAVFLLETQLGTTVLDDALALLQRSSDGGWTYREILQLPSQPHGYAFAPDGTLLVKDPHGAAAITLDRRIVPLMCAP